MWGSKAPYASGFFDALSEVGDDDNERHTGVDLVYTVCDLQSMVHEDRGSVWTVPGSWHLTRTIIRSSEERESSEQPEWNSETMIHFQGPGDSHLGS